METATPAPVLVPASQEEFRCCSCLRMKKSSCKVIGPTGKAVCTICHTSMLSRLKGKTLPSGRAVTGQHVQNARRKDSMRRTEHMIERVMETCGDL